MPEIEDENKLANDYMTEGRQAFFENKFEDELYNDAIRSGDVEFHSEPWSLIL